VRPSFGAHRARLDLGIWNTLIALIIATIKATVILYFMHAIHSTRLTWVVIIASFLWLATLFVRTFADYLTRHWAITEAAGLPLTFSPKFGPP